ncbi:hypothetical protein DM02DRAFT_169029 [Periconia macrospinosa]|uniref:Uncharacterized protein n=1 Tax=Periconia macrospinosa TaxID=97972 RepID=A0A2V1DAF6_9PLEO|nr:hypothetical protein DM02DRAFT_169029 [Periconia macrospinosa]
MFIRSSISLSFLNFVGYYICISPSSSASAFSIRQHEIIPTFLLYLTNHQSKTQGSIASHRIHIPRISHMALTFRSIKKKPFLNKEPPPPPPPPHSTTSQKPTNQPTAAKKEEVCMCE